MTVMSRLKSTNAYNKVLQTRHNEILFKIEKFWSECDADGKDCVSELLLDTCEIQRRDKQVCSWEIPLLDKDDKVVMLDLILNTQLEKDLEKDFNN